MSVQPPFTLYTLSAEAGTRNSPAVPAVHLVERDAVEGRFICQHTLTPDQARALADELIAAATVADRALPAR